MSGEPKQPHQPTVSEAQAKLDAAQKRADTMEAMIKAINQKLAGDEPAAASAVTEPEPGPVADPVAEITEPVVVEAEAAVETAPGASPVAEEDEDGFVTIPRDPEFSAPSAPMGTTHSPLEDDFMDLSVEAAMQEQKIKEYINDSAILYNKKGKRVTIVQDLGDGNVKVKYEGGGMAAESFDSLSQEEPEGLEKQERIDRLRKSNTPVYKADGTPVTVISDEGDGNVSVQDENGRTFAMSIDSLTETPPAENPAPENIKDWVENETTVYTADGFIGTIAGLGKGDGMVPVKDVNGKLLNEWVAIDDLSAKPPYETMEKNLGFAYQDFKDAYEKDIQEKGVAGRIAERFKKAWYTQTPGTKLEQSAMSSQTKAMYDDYLKKRYQLDTLKAKILEGKLGDQFTQTEKDRIVDKYRKTHRALNRIKEEQDMVRTIRREAMAEREQTTAGRAIDGLKKFTGLSSIGRKWNGLSPKAKKNIARVGMVGASAGLMGLAVMSGVGTATVASGFVAAKTANWGMGKLRIFRGDDFYQKQADKYQQQYDKVRSDWDALSTEEQTTEVMDKTNKKLKGLRKKIQFAKDKKREAGLDESIAWNKGTKRDLIEQTDLLATHKKLESIHGRDVWRGRAKTFLTVLAGFGGAQGASAAGLEFAGFDNFLRESAKAWQSGTLSDFVSGKVDEAGVPSGSEIVNQVFEKLDVNARVEAAQDAFNSAGETFSRVAEDVKEFVGDFSERITGIPDGIDHYQDSAGTDYYGMEPTVLPGAEASGVHISDDFAGARIVSESSGEVVSNISSEGDGMVYLNKSEGWDQFFDFSGDQLELKDGYKIQYDVDNPTADIPVESTPPVDAQETTPPVDKQTGSQVDNSSSQQQKSGQDQGSEAAPVEKVVNTSSESSTFAKEKVVRDGWYDNQTSKFDFNELKLHWGGQDGSGIVDINGTKHYELDVNAMAKDGSFRMGNEYAPVKDLLANDGFKMLVTSPSGGDSFVFDVVDGKIQIPANTDAGALFDTSNGQAYLKSGFVEVAEPSGADGHYKILATLESGQAPAGGGGLASAKAAAPGGGESLADMIAAGGTSDADAAVGGQSLADMMGGSGAASDTVDAGGQSLADMMGTNQPASPPPADPAPHTTGYQQPLYGTEKAIVEQSSFNDGLWDKSRPQTEVHTQNTQQEIYNTAYARDISGSAPQYLDRQNVTPTYYDRAGGYGAVNSPEATTPPNYHAQEFDSNGKWDPTKTTAKGAGTWSPPGMGGRVATQGGYPGAIPDAGERGLGIIHNEEGTRIGTTGDPLKNTFYERNSINAPIDNQPPQRIDFFNNTSDPVQGEEFRGVNRGRITGDAGIGGVEMPTDQTATEQPLGGEPMAANGQESSNSPGLYDVLWDALFGGSA